MGVGGDHSSESLGKDSIVAIQLGMAVGRLPSMATFLFKGAMLLGMLLAISGAASPWGGESGSQIESRPSSFLAAARDGVRSIMKRATGDEENNERKRKMGNSKSKKGRGKKEMRVKKRKNPTTKKSEKNRKKGNKKSVGNRSKNKKKKRKKKKKKKKLGKKKKKKKKKK